MISPFPGVVVNFFDKFTVYKRIQAIYPANFIAILSFQRRLHVLLQLVDILNTWFKLRGQLTFITDYTEMFELLTIKLYKV